LIRPGITEEAACLATLSTMIAMLFRCDEAIAVTPTVPVLIRRHATACDDDERQDAERVTHCHDLFLSRLLPL